MATRVNSYYGKGQILGITDVTLTSDNAPIYLWTPDRAFTMDDIHRIVRVTGILAGTGEECGGISRCWDIDYGYGRVIFRSASELLSTGGCITFVGPLGLFNGEPQLNVNNFSWMKIY